ncbi:MAG: HD domain-containing phosphohydrolase [Chloroflexota bacterium]
MKTTMRENLKVLIVEDTPSDAELMVLYLSKENFQVDWLRVESESAYLTALEQHYDLILSDWSLPQFSGLRALELMRERGLDIPFIIVSGGIGEEAAVAAMRQGASDYLLKDRMERLGQAVKNALAQKRLKAEIEMASQALAASEAELRGLFASMNEIVLVIDSAGTLRKVVTPKTDLLLKPVDQIAGKNLTEFFSTEQAHEFIQIIQQALKTRSTQTIEYELNINGRQAWFETTVSPLSDSEVIGVARDISQRKLAEKALRRHLQIQTQIAALGRELVNLRHPLSIARLASARLKQMTGSAYFSLSVLNPEDQSLHTIFAALEETELEHQLYPLLELGYNRTNSFPSRAIQSAQPIVITDPQEIQNNLIRMSGLGGQEMQSACCIPMLADEQVVGVIELQSSHENAFSEENLEWLTVAANQIGLSLQNAKLFAEIQQRLEELSVLAAIDSAVLSHWGPQTIYPFILEQITTRLKVDASVLLLYDAESQILRTVSAMGYHNPAIFQMQLRLGESLAGKAALSQKIIRQDLSSPENQQILLEEFRSEGFKDYIGIPLVADSQLIGVLELLHRAPIPTNQQWMHFLDILSNQASIAINTLQLYQNIQEAHASLLEAYDKTIEGWSRAMDMRDKETQDHTLRVTKMTLRLAQFFGLSEEQYLNIRHGALLHDIGKLGVPDEILLKPDSLTEAEWEIMRCHPQLAYEMLSPIDYLRPALDIPYCHHEKWDGSGYPRGLRGDQIPFPARLFAVVDVYDALTSDRPYRKAWSKESAIDYIRDQAGKHFDPQVVSAFLTLLQNGELI